jgi:hypothetical protein
MLKNLNFLSAFTYLMLDSIVDDVASLLPSGVNLVLVFVMVNMQVKLKA